MNYFVYPTPRTLHDLAPQTNSLCSPFQQLLGHTAFCDLFLQDRSTGEIAIFVASAFAAEPTGQYDFPTFVSQFLTDPAVVTDVLRPNEVLQLSRTLGALENEEGFFPVPHPTLGGSNHLETFDKGNLFVHLEIVAATLA